MPLKGCDTLHYVSHCDSSLWNNASTFIHKSVHYEAEIYILVVDSQHNIWYQSCMSKKLFKGQYKGNADAHMVDKKVRRAEYDKSYVINMVPSTTRCNTLLLSVRTHRKYPCLS